MLQVCASSTDTDLATTGDLMLELFGSTTTANVATTGEITRLGQLVTRASRWAETFVGAPLSEQVYLETVPAFGGRSLMLSRTPLVKFLRGYDGTDTGTAGELLSSEITFDSREAGLLSRDAGFIWTAPVTLGGLTDIYAPDLETRDWMIEYIAGYRTGGSTSTALGRSTADETWTTGPTLPEDITQGVILKAAAWYGRTDGVMSKRVGDLAIQYRSEGLDAAEMMLAPYRRMV